QLSLSMQIGDVSTKIIAELHSPPSNSRSAYGSDGRNYVEIPGGRTLPEIARLRESSLRPLPRLLLAPASEQSHASVASQRVMSGRRCRTNGGARRARNGRSSRPTASLRDAYHRYTCGGVTYSSRTP